MTFRNTVNDGTSASPRLRVQYCLWGAIGLPREGAKWSVDQCLDQVRDAGYTGFELFVQDVSEAEQVAGQLRERDLEFGLAVIVNDPDQLRVPAELARRVGAQYINAQVNGSLKSAKEIITTLETMYGIVNGAGVPFFVETHRGRVTQDLLRTVEVARGMPRLRLTGDFSHYVVAGELLGQWAPEVWEAFEALAARCGNWHGRISNGEQVQVDVGDGTGEMAQQFKRLWSGGMRMWLAQARPGDVLPFLVELGPPPYSITDLDGREISDRWQQGLVIRRLAEEAFAEACSR